jgi:hypothetical protein
MALAIFAHIFRAQSVRQHEIGLQGSALPVATDGVAQHKFEFWSVERALAGIERPFQAGRVCRVAQGGLRTVPGLVRPRPDLRPVGELHPDFGESQVGVNRAQEIDEGFGLGFDLCLGAKNMCVILGEPPRSQQTV